MKNFTQVFVRNVIFFCIGIISIFLIPITSCSYMHNQIPLSVEYFLPEEKGSNPLNKIEWKVNELQTNLFTPISKHFNPGYYDGELWLNITFSDPKDLNFYSSCILDLGLEPLEYAIAYYETSEGWILLGTTGRSIPSKDMTILSWRQSIPVTLSKLERKEIQHIRVKLSSKMGAPIYCKLLQESEWEKNTSYNSILNYVLSGFFLISIVFLFSFGAFLKDYLYTHLSFLGFILFFVLIQLKGTGPVFFWNNLSTLFPQNKQIYILSLVSIMATFSVFQYINLEIPGRKGIKASMYVICALTGFSILLNIIIDNAKINGIIFNLSMLSAFIILVVLLSIITAMQHSPLKLLTISWTIAFSLTIIRQSFHFFRTFLPWNFLTFFDTDRYYSYDFIYGLITIPALYITSRRIKKKYESLFLKYKIATNEIHKLQNEKKFMNQTTKEILDFSTILINTFSLPESPSREENEKTKAIIDKTLCHLSDYSTAICVINGAITPNYSPVMLNKFITSTFNIIESQAKNRSFKITFESSIPENYTVYTEPRILELILGDFTNQCIASSPKYSSVKINSYIEDNTLTYSIHIETTDSSENDTIQKLNTESTTYILVNKSIIFLGGEITQKVNNDEALYEFTIPFKNINQNSINSHTLISSSMHIHESNILNLNNENAPIIPDNILSVGNKVPSILLIENDENTATLLKAILEPHSNLTIATNGIEAWNYLNSTTQKKADLILCEYELPKMNGPELFSKLKDQESLENIPFLFLLDISHMNEELLLIQKGAASCIMKPFTQEGIINKLLCILNLIYKAQNNVLYNINKAVQENSSISSDFIAEKSSDMQEQITLEENQIISLSSSQEAIFKSFGLSKREQQIAMLILNGKSDKQIGDDLGISPQTVATHNKNLFKKLKIHSRIELINKLR